MNQAEAKARLDERQHHTNCQCVFHMLTDERLLTCDRCAELEQILENAKVPDEVRF